ncbi:hypothetical protein TNCV_336711, partial [Trichonephila clavipes]
MRGKHLPCCVDGLNYDTSYYPIKEENGMDDLRVVYVKVKGEQEMAGMLSWTQVPRCLCINKNTQMIRNPAKLRETFKKKEGIISSTDSKISLQPRSGHRSTSQNTESLLNVPNGDLVAVKINGSNVQTNGQ